MRRRRSTSASSGMSTWNGRLSTPVATLVLITTSVVAGARSVSCRGSWMGGRHVVVRGQELGQRRQQLVGRLLGNEVAGAGNDHALHVVRDRLRRVARVLTKACFSADRQDRHGQSCVRALLVLCDRRLERPVPAE